METIIIDESSDAAVRAAWDAERAANVASDTLARREEDIDAATQAHILSSYSENRQRNLTARAVELTEVKSDGGTLSAEEVTELTEIKAVWTWVKSALAEGDRLKADVNLTVADANFPTPP